MELKSIDHNGSHDERGNYTRDEYRIGNYVVYRFLHHYNNGTTYENFEIQANPEINFLPDIYYNKYSIKGNDFVQSREFKIQTSSYGSLHPAEIQQIIDGYKEALDVVNILTEKFLK